MKKRGIYEKYIKRFLDFVVSAILLVLLFPFLAILSVFIWKNLGRPALFRQERPGMREKIFVLYKFRSMTDKKDENGKLFPDEQRLTEFGSKLRGSSLDELPELINILKGDMSFIGPRPLLVQYLKYYTPDERRRHNVRPGLTGLAQINGRNSITWEERFRLDVQYVENVSFMQDLKIFIKTFKKVINKSDISAADHATMETFYRDISTCGSNRTDD